MIKIKVLNPTTNRNEPTFRVLMACRNLLRSYSIEITESDDFDYLFEGKTVYSSSQNIYYSSSTR